MKKVSKIKQWLLLSCCFLFLIICITSYISNRENSSSKTQNITLTDVGFDTSIDFQATCSPSEFDQYVTIVRDTFTKYNQLFDQYNSYEGINNVYTLNNEAADSYVQVDDDLIECIQQAQKVYSLSSQFDITQGAVLSLWHDAREESIVLNDEGKDGILPDASAIQEAMQHTGFDKLEIKNNTIHYLDPELKLDLGGIAKGYTAQKCKEILNENGLVNGFINAGGNVVLLSEKSDGWRIGIRNPDQQSSLVRYTTTKDKAIVTSGDYQRYYEISDQRYTHIIDPQTGYPSDYVRSVTIICNDSTLADGLSTALFNMSYEDGANFISSLQDTYDIGVIWILDKEKAITSDIECNDFIIETTDNIRKDVTLSN